MLRWPIFDPHSHIDPHRPAARNLDEILGYHYYTELAHSAGMPADRVASDLPPKARVRNLAEHLETIDNTVQYSWLLEIARTFHDFPHDRITPENIGELYDRADRSRDGEAPGTARSGTRRTSKPSSSPTTSTTRSKGGTPRSTSLACGRTTSS